MIENLSASDDKNKDHRPHWIDSRPSANQTHKYYVGRASRANTEKHGIEIATQDARIQAIQENYGIETRVSKRVKETLSDTDYKKDYEETSARTRIFGFEQLKIYSEEGKKGKDVWVLFRYPIVEIQKEKKRQRKLARELSKKVNFSTQGSAKDRAKGILEVVTRPGDVSVYIDGEPWGRTPLRVVGKISLGRHTLVLEKDGYQRVERDIIITKNGVEKVYKKMERGFGLVKIETAPLDGADITINGKRAGLSPTGFARVDSGVPVKVEVSHAEAYPKSFIMEVGIDEKKTKSVGLDLKPGHLRLTVFPRNAKVAIDGKSYSAKDLRNLKLNPYTEYQIEANHKNYKTHWEEFALKGGEKRNINIRLKREDIVYMSKKEVVAEKRKEKLKKDLAFLRESKYLTQYLSLGLGGSASTGGKNGLGQIGRVEAAFTGYFTFRHNGKINGLKIRYSQGISPAKEYDPNSGEETREVILGKLAFLFSKNIFARESYSTGKPPRLKPIVGPRFEIGAGVASGTLTLVSSNQEKYQFLSPLVSLRVGYDWKYFYASVGTDFYRQLPGDSSFLELGTEFLVSTGVRMRVF